MIRKVLIILILMVSPVYADDFDLKEYEFGKESLEIERKVATLGADIDKINLTFALRSPETLRLKLDRRLYIPKMYNLSDYGYYVYKVNLSNVTHDTTYEIYNDYQVYEDVVRRLQEGETVIAYFGDIQGYKKSQYLQFRTMMLLADKHQPDLTYLAGDIVDVGDSLQQWHFFDESISEMDKLYITVIGNHDVKNSSDLYEHTFNYTDNGLIKDRSFYVDLPFARIATIDTESFDQYDAQGEWLKEVMQTDKFKIVLMHRSVYPISYDEGFVRKFNKYFDAAKIDLVLSGHDHIYSRTQMLGRKQGQGTYYVVGGSGSGSKYYNFKKNRYWQDVIFDDNVPVYNIVKIEQNKISFWAYAVTNEEQLIDYFEINK